MSKSRNAHAGPILTGSILLGSILVGATLVGATLVGCEPSPVPPSGAWTEEEVRVRQLRQERLEWWALPSGNLTGRMAVTDDFREFQLDGGVVAGDLDGSGSALEGSGSAPDGSGSAREGAGPGRVVSLLEQAGVRAVWVDLSSAGGLEEGAVGRWEGGVGALAEADIAVLVYLGELSDSLVERLAARDPGGWPLSFGDRSSPGLSKVEWVLDWAPEERGDGSLRRLAEAHRRDFPDVRVGLRLTDPGLVHTLPPVGLPHRILLPMASLPPQDVHELASDLWEQGMGRFRVTILPGEEWNAQGMGTVRGWAAATAGAELLDPGSFEGTDLWSSPGPRGPQEPRLLTGAGERLSSIRPAVTPRRGSPLVPRDDLARDPAVWVLASPGDEYVLCCTSPGRGELGLRSIPWGSYELEWIHLASGHVSSVGYETVARGNGSWSPPDVVGGGQAALRLTRKSPGSGPAVAGRPSAPVERAGVRPAAPSVPPPGTSPSAAPAAPSVPPPGTSPSVAPAAPSVPPPGTSPSAPRDARATTSPTFPGAKWERMDPDELGWTEEALGRLSEDVGGDGCVVRSGYLVGCWGDPEREHDWGSAGKPLQTTLLFHAMAGGFVESLQIPISIFEWGVEGADTAITLTHLANMTSGYGRLEEPGGAFAYNDVAIGLYGETLERIFKADLDAVARRLFLPLHLTDRTLLESRGGFGLQSSVADAARIGLLWLHRGQWNGTEVIPRFLFDAHLRAYLPEDHPLSRAPATDYLDVGTFGGGTHQVDFGPGVYGFTWWFNLPYPAASREVAWPEVPPDLFMAVGHWGREMILMVPSWDLVVAWVSDREWPKEGMEPGRPDSRLGRIFGHLAGLQRDPGG